MGNRNHLHPSLCESQSLHRERLGRGNFLSLKNEIHTFVESVFPLGRLARWMAWLLPCRGKLPHLISTFDRRLRWKKHSCTPQQVKARAGLEQEQKRIDVETLGNPRVLIGGDSITPLHCRLAISDCQLFRSVRS